MNASKPNGVTVLRIAVANDYSYKATGSATGSMDLAVTSSREGKISTINVTDPYVPSYIKAVTDQSGSEILRTVRDIAINKNSGLAFATTIDAVLVIDIKDPYNPKLLNEIKLKPGTTIPIGTSSALTQRDGWVYLASEQNGIRTMDFYTPPLNAVDSSVLINSVNDVTVDLDGYTLGELKVNYTINPPGYEARNAKAMLMEKVLDKWVATATGSITGTGTAVFPMGMKLDKDKMYEVYIVLNCSPPDTKVSERKEIKLLGSCKVVTGGNLPDGARSSDGGSCCYQGEMQQNYPITDLGKCTNKVRNDVPDAPNGCGSENGVKFSDNPMWDTYRMLEFYNSKHAASDGDFKPACDNHDNCYADCNLTKPGCDVAFGAIMKTVCYRAFSNVISDALYLRQCLGHAILYEEAVVLLGKENYLSTQKKVCNCCYK